MSNIHFNSTTREIEIEGSESFIESNFHKIQALLMESFGEKRAGSAGPATTDTEPLISGNHMKPAEARNASTLSQAPEGSPAAGTEPHESPRAPRAARPPVRKYFNTLGKFIRSEDTSIHKSQTSEVLKQTPEELSVASLKEKFGLSEKQVEEIIKDAERQGRVKKDQDGSYVWV